MNKIKTKFVTSSGGLVYKIEDYKIKVALVSWKRGEEKMIVDIFNLKMEMVHKIPKLSKIQAF